MRAIISLPQPPFAERRHSRRRRRARHEAPAAHALETQPVREVTFVAHKGSQSDPAAQRVREAGGPIDQASYTCMCGYVFLAPVSTTVQCPHCSAAQAW
jgi:rubrerythrin